ncbi:uncharacterized protein LOC112160094 [Oryzias melastigma]|uniref:uncharacterized protein LOC112160094 n=1 Tax=Oryzias melastigma TaxID=30732 RepID=UPI000CF7D1C0|nr:uncharacterized protein LOC112160094 [Oryzias melastigma]
MAAVCQPRRALVEIPEPQPKTTAGLRRSYFEVLSAQLDSPPLSRARTSRPPQLLDSSMRALWNEPSTPLTKQQLVQLIRSLVLAEQSHDPRVAASSLERLQEDLQLKKTSVYRSIPYSRFGSNRDAHCYRKAYPHLLAFKVSCQEWGQVLLRNQEWDSLLEFCLMAWRYTGELPQWDTESHNALRDQCYGALAAHGLAALRHYHPAASRGRELLRRFGAAQLHSRLILPCIQELQRIMGHVGESTSMN